MCSGSRGEIGFVTLFFFSNSTPILVAKVARTRKGIEGLHREYTSLTQVSRLLQGSPLEATIDTALNLVELNGLTVLFKKYKDGIPGTQYVRSLFSKRRKIERFLNLSTDWLINFTKQTRESHLHSPDAKRIVIEELAAEKTLDSYARIFIEDSRFFLAPTHGELLPSNILIDHRNEQVGTILDFENFEMHGLPIADLLGLIVNTGVLLFGLNEMGTNRTFLRKGWFLNVCSGCIKKFCLEFSIDIETFKEVMPLYSDRAIQLCQKWNMRVELLRFHQRLRTFLIEKKNDILIG
jgi:hypothetical protein